MCKHIFDFPRVVPPVQLTVVTSVNTPLATIAYIVVCIAEGSAESKCDSTVRTREPYFTGSWPDLSGEN